MNARKRAQEALKAALLAVFPAARLDAESRVSRLEHNLVGGLTVAQLRAATAQIERGAGGELRPQPRQGGGRPRYRPPTHSPWSSATLALNSFGPYLGREHALTVLADDDKFDSVTFEEECPIFTDSPTAPNLDVILRAADGSTLAIESKCIEPLSTKLAELKEKYATMADLMHPTWRARYEEILVEKTRRPAERRFRRLDAAQLVKHYLGLKTTFSSSTTLLYLYWEPCNAIFEQAYQEHSEELARFAGGLADEQVAFRASTYAKLWSSWEGSSSRWVQDHVAELRQRYKVEI